MKLFKLIVLIYFLSYINSLNKFGSQIIDSYSSVTFISGEFKDNKEMHFSIKTLKNNFLDEYNYVTYYYIGQNGEDNSSQGGLYVIYERTENDEDYETKFFTITKKSIDYRPYDGNNMILTFYLRRSWGTVTNIGTEEEEEKKNGKLVIIIIIMVIVVVTAGIIIYCKCRRRKKIRKTKVSKSKQKKRKKKAKPKIQNEEEHNSTNTTKENYCVHQNADYTSQQSSQDQFNQNPKSRIPKAGDSKTKSVNLTKK